MRTLIGLLFLLSFDVEAYTLNNNFGAAFKNSNVNVYVASDTICPTSRLSVHELAALVKPAINNFWNKVPTSSLRLKAAGFAAPIGADINEDRLCAPTDTNCINNDPDPKIPPVKDILIACNSNEENYGGPASTNVLAVTVPNNFSGSKIAGAVILINDFSATFGNLSHNDKVSVIAHEIGHAIGLGHAESVHKEALMYYKTVDLRRALAQDDIDGVSYLYPVKMDGCGLFGGTITTGPKSPSFWQMGGTFALLILIFEMVKLLRRPKACAPA